MVVMRKGSVRRRQKGSGGPGEPEHPELVENTGKLWVVLAAHLKLMMKNLKVQA